MKKIKAFISLNDSQERRTIINFLKNKFDYSSEYDKPNSTLIIDNGKIYEVDLNSPYVNTMDYIDCDWFATFDYHLSLCLFFEIASMIDDKRKDAILGYIPKDGKLEKYSRENEYGGFHLHSEIGTIHPLTPLDIAKAVKDNNKEVINLIKEKWNSII